MLENRPVLRERVLAAGAISALLVGGVMAADTIIEGGWQWGTPSASTQAVYEDEPSQQWREPAASAPRSQSMNAAVASFGDADANGGDVMATMNIAQVNANLDGAAAPAVPLAVNRPRAAPAPQALPVEDASMQRFNQIEADMRQALPPAATDSSSGSPN